MWDWITEKWDSIEWGTAMEFFAAVGTVGALIVAYLLLRREADRDEERARERRSEQARQIAAWVGVRSMEQAIVPRQEGESEDLTVMLLNSSPSPAYDMRLTCAAVDQEGDRVGIGAVLTRILPPGETLLDLPPGLIAKWRTRKPTNATLVVDIEFTDGAGRRWRRTHDGVLTDLTDAENGAPAGS